MSNIKKGSKLTVSTANGISRATSNNLGVLEISEPKMTDIGVMYGSSTAHLVIGATDVSGILQVGINQLGNTFISANTDNVPKDIIMQKYGGNLIVGGGTAVVKVGVQTDQPSSTFHINSTDGIIIPVGTDVQRPDPAYQGMMRYNTTTSQFEGYGSGGNWGSLGGVINVAQNTKISVAEPNADSSNNEIKFYTAPTGDIRPIAATLRMIIDSAGNVGIGGGASSSHKLYVYGDVRANAHTIASYICHEGDENTYMSFGHQTWNVVTNGVERLMVNSTGLGIGRTPSYSLDVNGAAYFRGTTYLTSSTYLNGTTYLGSNYLYRTTSAYDYFGFPGAGKFGVVTNGNWRFWIKDNGYVGIGTTDPDEKLEVNGNTKTVSIYMDDYVYHNGAGGGTLFGFSDINEYIVNVGGITTLRAYIDGGTADRRLWTPKALYVGQWSTGTNLIVNDHQVYKLGTHSCFFNYSGTGQTYVGNTSNKTNFVGSLYIGGIVGIGTNNPRYPLDVDKASTSTDYTYWNRGGFNDGAYFATASMGGYGGSNYGQSEIGDMDSGTNSTYGIGAKNIAAHFRNNIYVSNGAVLVSSDRRIKTNVVDVSDNVALEMVRNIPCRHYHYIDTISRGTNGTIGFIAQEVKEIYPMAVVEEKQFIPNEMRNFDGSWNNNTLYTDLSDCSGVTYRFYVSNDPSGNDPSGNDYGEIRKDVIGNGDNSFTFDTSYDHVFCYGKQVDDFHTLDKHKLFALNFSATQEIDRKQLQEIIKVQTIQTDLSNVNTTIQQQATTIQQQAITIQQQATEISTLETQIADILTRLSNLENPSSG